METDLPIKGGCLCGKVRYEIAEPLLGADHCHCSMCRRQHGAAFSTYGDLNSDSLCWIAGEDRLKTYITPTGGGWCFCGDCGSTLAGTDNGKLTTVTLGSIEGSPGIKPNAHIFVGSKAQWHEITDDLLQYDEWPP